MTIYNILGTINAPQSDPENPTPALYSPPLKQEPLKSALTLSPSDLFQKISKGPSTEKKYKLEKFEQQDATKTLDFMNSHQRLRTSRSSKNADACSRKWPIAERLSSL